MKTLLSTATILALSAGVASAEITLSGDARMGVINDFGDNNTGFTSRARVKFTLSGETDGGLAFGADFRADNAGSAASGLAGSVYISGAFGKLTMGDIDGAAQQAVGNVDGVGLTGLSDLNEAIYIHNWTDEFFTEIDPSASYEYSAGNFTGILSYTNPAAADRVWALGVKYAAGNYAVALGYEDDGYNTHVILGLQAALGNLALKGNFGQFSEPGLKREQYHLSATYSVDALAFTAFYGDELELGSLGQAVAYGVGASYDLGGGAKLVGGYANMDTADADAFDLGLSFSF